MKRSGLGRGLSALLPEAGPSDGTSALIAIDSIKPNPYQPRHDFSEETLEELADSIRQHGLMQPIMVRQAPEGDGYQLVAGERRWRASALANLDHVPAIVRECNEREMLEMALVENVQREDLNAIDAAEAYRRCLDEFGLTQEELAHRLGKSRASVANTLRLLKLADEPRAAILDGRLSEGHGRALLSLPSSKDQVALARRVLDEGLTVRQTEAAARAIKAHRADEPPVSRATSTSPPSAGQAWDADLAAFTARLERGLGMRVEIRAGADGGRLIIHYLGIEDLENLAEALGC